MTGEHEAGPTGSNTNGVLQTWNLISQRRGTTAVAVVAAFSILMWLFIFLKVGIGIDFAAKDVIRRVRQFPDVLITGDVNRDYRSWSVLPIGLSHVLTVTTRKSMVFAMSVVLVIGTSASASILAYFRGLATTSKVLAIMFATSVPAMTLFFGGTGDQVLVVLMLCAALLRHRWLLVVAGLLLGATHAEIAAIALVGLVALAWADRDTDLAIARAFSLAAVIVTRIAIGIWFAMQGNVATRLDFALNFGFGQLFQLFTESWLPITITIATGGWLLLIDVVLSDKRGRHAFVVTSYVLIVLCLTSITVDESRVGMLCLFAPLVHLAHSAHTPSNNQLRRTLVLGSGAIIGLATPLVIVWSGRTDWIVGTPLGTPW